MPSRIRTTVAALALSLFATSASAAVTIRTFDFTATNFGGSPIRSDTPLSISGSFAVQYDPAVATGSLAAGYIDTPGVLSFSTNTSHPSFAVPASNLYFQNRPFVIPGVADIDYLMVGQRTALNGDDVPKLDYRYLDFSLVYGRGLIGAPGSQSQQVYDSLCFVQTNNGGILCTENGGMTITEVFATAGGVPEPATWAMMIFGFGAVGSAMRSAKRKQAVTSIV